MTSNAPICGRNPKVSHYPPAGNCASSQFLPGQKSNSFRGETLIRVTTPVRQTCLAKRLDGIQLAYNPNGASVENCDANQDIRLVTVGVLHVVSTDARRFKLRKWQNN
jgi:hypothetical protein